MTAYHVQDRYSPSSYQTIYPDCEENRKIIDSTKKNFQKDTQNWKCIQLTAWLFSTICFVSTVLTIICAASGCYGSVSDDDKQWCDSTCSPAWIAAAGVTCIVSPILCCIAKAKS